MQNDKPAPLPIEYRKLMLSPAMVACKKVVVPLVRLMSDYCAIVVSIFLAIMVRERVLPMFFAFPEFSGVGDVYIFIVVPAAFIFFLQFDGLYKRRLVFWDMAGAVFKSTTYAVLFLLVLLYMTGDIKVTSRTLMIVFWFISFPSIIIGRYMIKKVLVKMRLWQIPVILVGAGKTAELILNAFERDSGLGYEVVGLIEDNLQQETIFQHYPVIGSFASAEAAIARSGIKDVLIAAPGLAREELARLIYRIQPHVDNIVFVPDLFGIPVAGMELETLYNEKAIMLRVRNNLARWHNRLLKMVFDMTVSLLALILVTFVAGIIAILIYLDSPGPVIFAHKRIGQKGRLFPCYKFRTMVPDAEAKLQEYLDKHPAAREEWEQEFKLKDDPRITKVGRFLRRTSLDELPQFLNVLRGEMSLVGPRPIVQGEVAKYGEYIHDYYLVRPGVTGIWQISGRNDIDYPERVRMDSWYTRNWSLWIDIVVLFKTVKVVLDRKGAY